MARTQKIIKENKRSASTEKEINALLTVETNEDVLTVMPAISAKVTEPKMSTFVITAKFKGLHLNGNIFDNMKVILFECKASESKEAKEKFITVIKKVFPNESPFDFISRVFGKDIELEEYNTVNKSISKFF